MNTATLYAAETTDTGTPMLLSVNNQFFYRNHTGARGRGAAWHEVKSLDDLSNSGAAYVATVPVTARDLELLKAGQLTPINVKVMREFNEGGIGNMTRVEDEEIVSFHTLFESAKPVAAAPVAREAVQEPVLMTSMTSVPDIRWHKEYIQRKVVGDLYEYDIYDIALSRKENVLISGPAGSGKTISVMAYSAARGHNYYNVSSHNGVEHTQLFGRWVPTPNGTFRWQDGPVTEIVRNGGVLLINEVNFLPERVKTVLFSLLDKRREIQLMDKDGEVVKAADNLLIIADMNPGYRGTKPLNEAEKDRYAHKLEFGYDKSIEAKLIKSRALLDLASNLRVSYEREEIVTPISTRSLVAFMSNASDLGLDYAIYSFLNGFHEGERNAVRLACETRKANIAADLGIQIDVLPQQWDETVVFTSTLATQA